MSGTTARLAVLALVLVAAACGADGTTSPEPRETVTVTTPSTTDATEPTRSPTPTPTSSATTTTTSSALAAAVAKARTQLPQLVVTARPRLASDYHRDAFGYAWADIDGNGCNQRDDVLLRDAVKGTVRIGQQGACDHDVLAGTWIDPYSGRQHVQTDMKDLSQAQAVQIDHVVPLAEAWVSGARGWSDARRELYANDLRGLLAVDGPTNASKGASDPAAWKPRKGFQCRYAVRWILVKHRWKLSVDPSEVRALQEMLGYC